MPDLARSVQVAAGATTARVTVQGEIPSGIVWVVSQVGVEAITAQVAVTAVLRKNGRYISSSNQGTASSASGAPYISLKAGDVMTMDWTGLTPGDSAILSLFYNEIPWSQLGQQAIDVV